MNIDQNVAQRQADFIDALEEQLAELKSQPVQSAAPVSAVSAQEPEPIVRMTFDLSRALHRRFRTICSELDRNMTDELRGFVVRFIAEHDKKGG